MGALSFLSLKKEIPEVAGIIEKFLKSGGENDDGNALLDFLEGEDLAIRGKIVHHIFKKMKEGGLQINGNKRARGRNSEKNS